VKHEGFKPGVKERGSYEIDMHTQSFYGHYNTGHPMLASTLSKEMKDFT